MDFYCVFQRTIPLQKSHKSACYEFCLGSSTQQPDHFIYAMIYTCRSDCCVETSYTICRNRANTVHVHRFSADINCATKKFGKICFLTNSKQSNQSLRHAVIKFLVVFFLVLFDLIWLLSGQGTQIGALDGRSVACEQLTQGCYLRTHDLTSQSWGSTC